MEKQQVGKTDQTGSYTKDNLVLTLPPLIIGEEASIAAVAHTAGLTKDRREGEGWFSQGQERSFLALDSDPKVQ